MDKITTIGDLRKYKIIDLSLDNTINSFFESQVNDGAILEDILYDWTQDESLSKFIIFPIDNYLSQINTISRQIPAIYPLSTHTSEHQLLFLEEIERLGVRELRNTEELSGEGRLITTFELKFTDYTKKYLRDPNLTFFKLNSDEVILNSIRLTSAGDTGPSTLGLNLTGKAAEIAKRRKHADRVP